MLDVSRSISSLEKTPVILWSGSLILALLSLAQSHTTVLPISALGLVQSLSLYYWSGLGVLIAGYAVALQYSAHSSKMLVVFPLTIGIYLIAIPQLVPGIVFYPDVPGHFASSLYVSASGQIAQGPSELAAYPAAYIWGAILLQITNAGGLAIPKMFPFLAVIALGICAYSISERVLGNTKFASVATCVFMILLLAEQAYLWFSPEFYGCIILVAFILSLGRLSATGGRAMAMFILGMGVLLSDPGNNLVILVYLSMLLFGIFLFGKGRELMRVSLALLTFGAAYDFFYVNVTTGWSLLYYIKTAAAEASSTLSLASQTGLRYSNPNPTFGFAVDIYAVASIAEVVISCGAAYILMRRRKTLTSREFCILVLFVSQFVMLIFGTAGFRPRILEYLPLSAVPLVAIGMRKAGLARRRPSITVRALVVALISFAIIVSLFVGYSTASYDSYSESQQASMEYLVTFSGSNINASTVNSPLGLYSAILAGGTASYLTASSLSTFPNLGFYTNSSGVCIESICSSGGLSDAIGNLSRFEIIVVGGEQAPAEWALRFSENGTRLMVAVEQEFDATRDRVGVFGGAYPSVVYA